MTDHELYLGTDGRGQQFLVTVWHSGGAEVAVRHDDHHTWGVPVQCEQIPADIS